jgi:energy-converting hydrogenase Eha subunit C
MEEGGSNLVLMKLPLLCCCVMGGIAIIEETKDLEKMSYVKL